MLSAEYDETSVYPDTCICAICFNSNFPNISREQKIALLRRTILVWELKGTAADPALLGHRIKRAEEMLLETIKLVGDT